MDFRSIDASRVRWVNSKVCYGAGKVLFQTPPMTYTCTHAPVAGRIQLRLERVDGRLRDLLREIETSYDGAQGRQRSDTVSWDDELSLTTYTESECLWFEEDGTARPPFEHARQGVCACIVLITGVWSSPTLWGLKIVLKEVKEMKPLAAAPPPVWHFR